VLWGSFNFNYDHQNERKWSDLFTNNNDNPYKFGSVYLGRYNKQTYDIKTKISTRAIGRFTLGLGFDYKVGDLSRLRDPRSRVLYANYAFKPSLTYKLNKNTTLGGDFYYRFEKERLNDITSITDEKEYEYYLFEGLENAVRYNNYAGISRRNVANILGGDIQFEIKKNLNSIFVEAGFYNRHETITEDERKSPGEYNEAGFSFNSGIRLVNSNSMHSINVGGKYHYGESQQFIQEEQTYTYEDGTISTWWETLYDNVVYKVNRLALNAEYDYFRGDVNNNDYNMSLGVFTSLNSFKKEYVLPSSEQKIGVAEVGFKFSGRLYNKDQRKLWIEGDLSQKFSITNDLSVYNENIIYSSKLLPDMAYYDSSVSKVHLNIKYLFPIKSKQSILNLYVKAFANGDFTKDNGRRTMTGFAIGILSF